VLLAAPATRASAPENEAPPRFERDVRPILKAYCLDCHGGSERPKGKLDLRLKRFAERGGTGGPALVPGEPDASLLLIRMQDGEMPPGEKKVPPEQVALVERWIAAGAPTLRPEPETLPPGLGFTEEERSFWAFQPIRRPEPPRFGAEDRVRTPVDAFLLARLREHGLGFAPDADRLTLLRRVAADLTGLPPDEDEAERFLADPAPDAYERLVDRLLTSPRYGERWARHWLDVAGYADSEGNGNDDTPRPHAYRYRDYVVKSLNANLPLDRFVTEQLAGDELVPRPWDNLTPEQVELLAATGFLRQAADGTASGGADVPLLANQNVADTLKVVSSALLGLTVGCAQCHDHRYDPITQADYFRLRAVFEPALDPAQWRRPADRLVSLYRDADRARAAEVEAEAKAKEAELAEKTKGLVAKAIAKELEKFDAPTREALKAALDAPAESRTDEQKALIEKHPSVRITPGVLYQYDPKAADEIKKDREAIAAIRAKRPREDFVAVADERPGVVPETKIHHRGDYRQPTTPVAPGDLSILSPDSAPFEVPADDPALPTTGRRLAFAKHLTSGNHPLVGRVLANRVWLHHFGRGLVDTPGDLGALGQRPTHPELLDWLADELARSGWDLKRMHRLIVTSTAYRQSSRRRPEHDAVDATNALCGRYPVQRLDAEALRDRVIWASGRLSEQMFGPAVPVEEDALGQVVPAGNVACRSLYLQVRRSRPVSLLTVFDAPVMAVNCERRTVSTAAPQSLLLMNGDFLRGEAAAMADRILRDAGAGRAWPVRLTDAVARAWTLAYGRPVRPEEQEAALAFLGPRLGPGGDADARSKRLRAALTDLCAGLLASNEFLYVD
jgi:hypothetical protein